MYAIVETSGKQYRVEPGRWITVDRMDGEEGDTISLDRVLMIGGESVKLGAPTIAGATVEARIRTHEKGDKVITFKYLHRRRFRRKVGFRHSHTTLEIVAIHG
jgi:large subunit ribosomal protein L21